MATLTQVFDPPQQAGDEIRMFCAAVLNYRGGAASVILGTGYATPLVVGTAGTRFVGVYLAGVDNSAGAAGDKTVQIARTGIFEFNQTGLTQADVGKPAFFSDDNTIATTPTTAYAGVIVNIGTTSALAEVCIDTACLTVANPGLNALAASGAIAPRLPADYVITKAGVAALTLAAPTATVDDGQIIVVTSGTAFAHTLTATGLLNTGAAAVNLATFAAFAGAGLVLMAYQGKWNVISQIGITFS